MLCMTPPCKSNQVTSRDSRLLRLLQCLGLSKTWTTPLHLPSNGMVNQCVKTVEEHMRMAMPALCSLTVAHLVDWLHDVHHYIHQHLKVGSARMKAWPVLCNFRKETMSGCTVQPRPEESHPSYSNSVKAYIRWTLRLTTWCAGSSDIEQKWWCCTRTDCCIM
jgi:hypothetical protein